MSQAKLDSGVNQSPRSKGSRPTDQELLDAALPAVAAVGCSSVTMDQLAVAANTTKQTLYAHFSTKEGLLQALVSREFAAIHGAFMQAITDAEAITDEEEQIRIRIAPAYRFGVERPDGARVLADRTAPGHRERAALLTGSMETMVEEHLTARLGESGAERRTHVRVIAASLTSLVAATTSTALSTGLDTDAAIDLTAKMLVAARNAALTALE